MNLLIITALLIPFKAIILAEKKSFDAVLSVGIARKTPYITHRRFWEKHDYHLCMGLSATSAMSRNVWV